MKITIEEAITRLEEIRAQHGSILVDAAVIEVGHAEKMSDSKVVKFVKDNDLTMQ